MKKVVETEREEAVRITALYSDFAGDVTAWRNAFYELWRYQMTWGFAWELTLQDSRKVGVFVDILSKPAFAENVISTMEDLGYKNVKHYDEKIAMVDGMAFDEDDIVVDY